MKFVFMYEVAEESEPGIAFNKWLPNGAEDAIVVCREEYVFRVWSVRGESCKHCHPRLFGEPVDFNIEPDAMRKAWVLYGRELYGEIEFCAEVGGSSNGFVGDEFVKNVAGWVCMELNLILQTLRVDYGQYWLGLVPTFDRRFWTLRQYVNMLNLGCGDSLRALRLEDDQYRLRIVVPLKDNVENFLSEDDWSGLGRCEEINADWVSFLTSAREYWALGKFGKAYVEAQIALEVVVNCAIDERMKIECFKANIGSIYNLALGAKLALVVSFCSNVDESMAKAALECFEFRNKIVHEGFVLNSDDLMRNVKHKKRLEKVFSLICEIAGRSGTRTVELV